MKAFSKSTEYALRALVYLVMQGTERKYVGIKDIAENTGLSFYFLTKIFGMLTEKGILTSYRGPNGGVTLLKPASEVMLSDIVRILEGENYFDRCLLGLPGCGLLEPCPAHHFWSEFKASFKTQLEQTSLAHLGEKTSLDKLRLTG